MNVLVLGCTGQLGQALAESADSETAATFLSRSDLDVTCADSVASVFKRLQPDVVVNTAAFTAVDRAESVPEQARATNVDGAHNVALGSASVGARLIHVSTDFVFDGHEGTPYAADAPTNPLNVYGHSKRDGELAVLRAMPDSSAVIRTSWLYSRHGDNFVKTMLAAFETRDRLKVVDDQIGTPTWATSFAEILWMFANRPQLSGLFHWADGGATNWYEFAIAIQEEALSLGLLHQQTPIERVSSIAYATSAKRPAYSVLDTRSTSAALALTPTPWRVNLRRMLEGMVA